MTRQEVIKELHEAEAKVIELEAKYKLMIFVNFQKCRETKASELGCDRIRIWHDKEWYLETSYNWGRELWQYNEKSNNFTLKFTEKWVYNDCCWDGKPAQIFKAEQIKFEENQDEITFIKNTK